MASSLRGGSGRRVPVSATEAVSGITSRDRIFVGGVACPPDSLVEALAARANSLQGVRVWHLPMLSGTPFVAPELAGSFRLTTSFVGSELREPVGDGRADFIPIFLSETPALFATRHPLDWAIVQLSPPDRHGYCSAGISVDITLGAIRHARHVITEINPNVPRTLGDR
jgi:4-hydroxybutyrate CoA-transferase